MYNFAIDLQNRIHIFCREGVWLCFDRDSNRIFKLTEEEAVALQHVSEHPEYEITPKQNLILAELEKLIGESVLEYRELEPVNTFYLRLNRQCNLQCDYCRAISKAEKLLDKRLLNPELASRAANVMMKLGAKGVGLHGGEPIMDWDNTADVLCAIRKESPSLVVGLTCNGTLITEEIARFLKTMNVRVSVELDGSQKIYDKFKCYVNGRSSYEDALTGAKLLRDQGILVAIESTVSGIEGYDNEGYQNMASMFPEIPIVVARIKSRETMQWVCHGKALENFLRQQLENIGRNKSVVNDAVAGLVNLCSSPSLSAYRCICLLDKVSVDLDGSVYLCPKKEDSHTLIGNVTDEDFVKTFHERRLQAAQRFAIKPIESVWYSGLTEYCVDSTYENDAGQDKLQDEDVLSRFYEDLIYFSVKNDTSFLWDRWVNSGF